MKIECAPFGPFETNCYLLTDEAKKTCAVIDAPPGSAKPILAELERRGLTPECLLLTHGHWDHMADAHLFQKAGVKVYAHKDDRVIIEEVARVAPKYKAMVPWLTDADFTPCTVDVWLEDGDTVTVLGVPFGVRHVPGHCPGSLLFHCPSENLAFSGDAIFAGSVGRTDLPGGDWNTLLKSIREKIYTLPEETVLFPGHGGETSVEEEMASNRYARPA